MRSCSGYQRELRARYPSGCTGTVAGELIIVFSDLDRVRWKLRKRGLSTDVDKPVSNSKLNHDLQLRAYGIGSAKEQGVRE
jgi:hypothetical protein